MTKGWLFECRERHRVFGAFVQQRDMYLKSFGPVFLVCEKYEPMTGSGRIGHAFRVLEPREITDMKMDERLRYVIPGCDFEQY